MSDGRDAPAVELLSSDVVRLSLPVPFASGPVNCYLLLKEPRTLIDTGPRTDEARHALEAGLQSVNAPPESFDRILITHAHIDHHGLLGELLERSEARVFVHEDDADDVIHFQRRMDEKMPRFAAFARRWGWKEEVVTGFLAFREFFQGLADDLSPDRVDRLTEEEGELPDGLHFVHSPGHTAGLTVFFDSDEGRLFAADQILPTITPNPCVYAWPYRGAEGGLGHYLESCERLSSLPVERVCPGHGRPFATFQERLAEIRHHHNERVDRIMAILKEGPSTVVALIERLWTRLGPGDRYLASKEIFAHLDLLRREGRVVRIDRDGVDWWELKNR